MGDRLPRFKAAAVQAAPAFLDREATVEKAVRLIKEAAGRGASLVIFPETWIPGYPVWANKLIANRDLPQAKALFARLWKNAVEIPSPATNALCQAARSAEVHVVMGLNEREGRFGRSTLYNSILFIGPQGNILGVHRKLMPTFHERTLWGWGDGSGLTVWDTPVGRLSGLICWEHWMPLARYAIYAQGEQIHAALWPSLFPANSLNGEMVQSACRFYAHEGRTFVIGACGWLAKGDLPTDMPLDVDSWPEVLLAGGSSIIGPNGEYLAGPSYEGETTIYADIDLERAVEARQSLDVTGHYARPDVLRLVVDRSPHDPAQWLERGQPIGWEREAQQTTESATQRAEALRQHMLDELLEL